MEFTDQIRDFSLSYPSYIFPVIFFGSLVFYLIYRRFIHLHAGLLKSFTQLIFSFAVTSSLLLSLVHLVVMTGKKLELLMQVYSCLLTLILTRFFLQLVDHFWWNTRFKKLTGQESPRLLKSLLAMLVYLTVIYFLLTLVFEISVTGFLVSTSILAGVIGLSLQNILADFFSGIALTVDQPYKVGDWIELKDGQIGRVVDINWRSTRLLSWYNNYYIVPNSEISRTAIQNYSMPDQRYAMWYFVRVSGQYPVKTVVRVLREAVLACKSVLDEPAPVIRLSDATRQPYEYMVYVFFAAYPSHFKARGEMFAMIHQFTSQAGIPISAERYDIQKTDVSADSFSAPDVRDILAGHPFFSDLKDDELERLAAQCREVEVAEGETIHIATETPECMYIINSGVFSMQVDTPDSSGIEVSRLGSGATFGEMLLLTGSPAVSKAVALSDGELIELPRSSLEDLMHANSNFARHLAAVLTDRQQSEMNSEEDRPLSQGLRRHRSREMLRRIARIFNL